MTAAPLVITGVEGFVGTHLARLARAQGIPVIGIGRGARPSDELRASLVDYHALDARDDIELDIPAPLAVVHLAALAAVGPSFDRPKQYVAENPAMTISVAEWMLTRGWTSSRLVVVSTGAVYGSSETAIREDFPVDVSSPYVVSKLASELVVDHYARRGLDTVTMRPFNHFGPGQGAGFILPDLIAAVRQAARTGLIQTGNLSTRRDYTDVRDVARAYLRVATAPSVARRVYNVGSGVSRAGTEILEAVFGALGIRSEDVEVEQRSLRPVDVLEVTADAGALRREMHWRPEISFADSVRDAVRAGG